MQNEKGWKVDTPGGFFIYGALFLVFFVLSPFYAWGIHDLLDKFAPESKTRNSFSFGDELVIVTGIFLGLAAYNDISKQMRKVARLTKAVAECETLMDQFSTVVATSNLSASDKASIAVAAQSSTQKILISPKACILDCATLVIMCPVFLIYEMSQRRESDVQQIIQRFRPVNTTATESFHIIRSIISDISGYTAISSGVMSIFAARVLLLQNARVILEGSGDLCATIANNNVRSAINEYENSLIETGWWVISLVYTILGVLYLFLAPFLLWFGQGWFMLYSYPVIFLLVGGLTSYRWFIGDVLTNPRELFIRPVYSRLKRIAMKGDLLTANSVGYSKALSESNIT